MGRNRGLGNENESDLVAIVTDEEETAPTLIQHAGQNWIDSPMVAFSNTAGKTLLSASSDTAPAITGSKGNPGMIAWSIRNDVLREDRENVTPHEQTGLKIAEEVAPTIDCGQAHAVAFSCKDDGGDATEDLTPTLRSMGEVDGNQNGGGQLAVAFDLAQITSKVNRTRVTEVASTLAEGSRMHAISFEPDALAFEPRYYTRDNKTGGAPSDTAALKADASKAGDSSPHVAAAFGIRRLIPMECERLQGFPDNYTLVPDPRKKGKLAADQPRYHALGNSMAVPVMEWIGRRIQAVEDLAGEQTA